jgi:hypothetical protein
LALPALASMSINRHRDLGGPSRGRRLFPYGRIDVIGRISTRMLAPLAKNGPEEKPDNSGRNLRILAFRCRGG